ncbi:MAG: hypothetical protein ACKOJF_32355, partial [Planctomycetaceae bacterium]
MIGQVAASRVGTQFEFELPGFRPRGDRFIPQLPPDFTSTGLPFRWNILEACFETRRTRLSMEGDSMRF